MRRDVPALHVPLSILLHRQYRATANPACSQNVGGLLFGQQLCKKGNPKMASQKRNTVVEQVRDKEQMLDLRLRLIKKRYEELIIRPRNGLMRGLLDEDGFDELDEREEEMQVLECYGLGG